MDNPDMEQFKTSVRASMMETLLRSSTLSNCEDDGEDETFLFTRSKIFTGNLPEVLEQIDKSAAVKVQEEKVTLEASKICNCPVCTNLMTVSRTISSDFMLFYFKKYYPSATAQGLRWPSAQIVAVVE